MKKLNFKKKQTCGLLLATSIVLTSCQKEEENIYFDKSLASQTSIEELFTNPSMDTLNVNVVEKEEMLERKILLEEELQAHPNDYIIDINDLRVIDNKVNGQTGYSLGVVQESSVSDKSFVFTLGEEKNVYVYRDGNTYNTTYIMKLDDVIEPADFHWVYNNVALESLLAKIQEAQFLAPCTSYSEDRKLTDPEHIAANGVFICNSFSYLSPVLQTSTRPKLYIHLDNCYTTGIDCYGLQSYEITESNQSDTDYIISYSDSRNHYQYRFGSYKGNFEENPFISLNDWLKDNGLADYAKDVYSLDELILLENAIQQGFANPYTITTEEAFLANSALHITVAEKEEMLVRKDNLAQRLQDDPRAFVDKDAIFVINNEINGGSGYSIGTLGNSHISDKGLIVTYGDERNVYVYRDGDQYNTEYIMKIVDVIHPEDLANHYTDSDLRNMIEKINTYSAPLVPCTTYSEGNRITNDQCIPSSGIYICDSFDTLYPATHIPTAPRVYVRMKDDDEDISLGISFFGLNSWNINGEYSQSDRVHVSSIAGERYYYYFYRDGNGVDYDGDFPENPLIPINEWLMANGYDAYVQDTYSVDELEAIDNAIKDVMSYSKQYSE